MSWIVLFISAILEAIWATALGASENFTKLTPSVVFLLAFIASMFGLAYAVKQISIGTAYAVWTGVGAVLTVIIAAVSRTEEITALKVLFLSGIIFSVIGLKLTAQKQSPETGHKPLSDTN
ncbi:MAG: multidrug efflux SMR transporter [Arcanobacterium sp.]|nr:multidrug efflux SMR transporter [Arcanobacterium sp.]